MSSVFRFGAIRSPPRRPTVQGSEVSPFCTSPSQLHEVTADGIAMDASVPFSLGLQSPRKTSPFRGQSVREYEEQLASLKKENFNLKLRIYFLEERMGHIRDADDKENTVKKNIELKVQLETLHSELRDKQELLCKAAKALDVVEEQHRKQLAEEREHHSEELKSLQDLIQQGGGDGVGMAVHHSMEQGTRQLEELRASLAKRDAAFTMLEVELQHWRDQAAQHEATIKQLQTRLATPDDRTRTFESRLDAMSRRVHDLKAELQLRQEGSAAVERAAEESLRRNEELEARVRDAEAARNEMKELYNKACKAIQGFMNKNKELGREVDSLSADLRKREQQVQELSTQLLLLRDACEGTKPSTGLAEENEGLPEIQVENIRVDTSTEEITRLREEVQRLRKKVKLLEQEREANKMDSGNGTEGTDFVEHKKQVVALQHDLQSRDAQLYLLHEQVHELGGGRRRNSASFYEDLCIERKERHAIVQRVQELQEKLQDVPEYGRHQGLLAAAQKEIVQAERGRKEALEACELLRHRLEELAGFLSSLLDNPVSPQRCQLLRHAVEQSLRLSTALSVSLTSSHLPDLSLMRLEALGASCPAHLSDSEVWSEPDRDVSQARIGLAEDSLGSTRKGDSTQSSEGVEVSRSDVCRTPGKRRLQAKLHALEQQHEALRTASQELETQLQAERKCIGDLEAHSQQQTAESEQALREVNQRLQESQQLHEGAVSRAEQLQSQVEQAQATIQDLDRQLADVRQSLRTTVQNAEADMAAAHCRLQEEETKRCELEEQLRLVEKQLKVVLGERDSVDRRRQELERELKVALRQKQSVEDRLRDVERRREEERRRRQQIEEKLKAVEKSGEEIVQRMSAAETCREQAERKLKEMEKRKLEVEERATILSKSKQHVEQILQETEKQVKEAKVRVQMAEQQEQQAWVMRADLERKVAEAERLGCEFQRQAEESKSREADLRRRLDDSERRARESDLQASQSAVERTRLNCEKVRLERELCAALEQGAKCSELQQQVAKLQETNSELEKALRRDMPWGELVPRRQRSEASECLSEEPEYTSILSQSCTVQWLASVGVPARQYNSSPDLGIESDHGRFSSLETNPRPVGEMCLALATSTCSPSPGDCPRLRRENTELRRRLHHTRLALEETLSHLSASNERKRRVEQDICKQLHKTHYILTQARGGMNTDIAEVK